MSVRALDAAQLVPVPLARRLRETGLRWDPTVGDRFVLADRDMDAEVFVVSDMVADVHQFPSGPVIGFNGTVEWALDSVGTEQTLWLPSEEQLRRLLGGTFRRLERAAGADGDDRLQVTVVLPGDEQETTEHAGTAVEAYAAALLRLLERATA
ncbi:pilus assembly protein CpaE [Aquipuribacter hungaricus]|uniref:Pilus assembly protein CpaE n=1 Tax=Aquipuribacter hungaricus TaxID=545624 RepID=A0ABV7WFA7_9MICO